jgi:anthranilate synthase component 1
VGYDTVRYQYTNKLPFDEAPVDDRNLPDLCLGMYRDVVIFDHATKQVFAVHWADLSVFHGDVERTLSEGEVSLGALVRQLQPNTVPSLPFGEVSMSLTEAPIPMTESTMTKDEFLSAVSRTKEHILAGDVFQLVLSHRFSKNTYADPFDVYRALRVVNPSPYMIYLQARGSIVVASSPEILCRTDKERKVVNRPLAGTRKRGATEAEDVALERDLLADEKEKAEHTMLVDLGRNDVGRVSKAGTVRVEKLMEVERYSHVMHISSTVTGSLLDELGPWDVLRAALPAGTVSGAPKVRAMQIIDDLETTRRGPYGGGVGYVGFMGEMDMALALRTMVVPTAHEENIYKVSNVPDRSSRREWTIHIQSGAGIVADSHPESEYQETVNKAAALARAIDLAEEAFDV